MTLRLFREYWTGVAHLQRRGFAACLGEVMALLDDVMVDDVNYPLVAFAGDIRALGIFGKILQIGGIIEKYY